MEEYQIPWTYDHAKSVVRRDFDPDGDVSLVMAISSADHFHQYETDNEEGKDEEPNSDKEELTKQAIDLQEADSAGTVDIEMLVSSKHLSLASSVFKVMLRPNFKEGIKLHTDRKLTLPLPDDDAAAFSILLNVIHGHHKSVPRRLDLKLLTRVSVLVDKYRLHDVVSVYSEMWTADIDSDYIPSSRDDRFLSHLCISWVFCQKAVFNRSIGIAMQKATGRIDPQELPIPGKVLDYIEALRVKALNGAICQLRALVTNYDGRERQCLQTDGLHNACDALIFGSLMTGLRKVTLWPLPCPPYIGIDPDSLRKDVEKLEVSTLCEIRSSNGGRCGGVRDSLASIVKALVWDMSHLDKDRFIHDISVKWEEVCPK